MNVMNNNCNIPDNYFSFENMLRHIELEEQDKQSKDGISIKNKFILI